MYDAAKLNLCDPPLSLLSSSFVCHSIGDIEMKEGREGRTDTKQSRDDSESMNLNDTNSVFVVEQLRG